MKQHDACSREKKDNAKEIGEYPNEKTFDQPQEVFGQRERKHSSSDKPNVLEEKRKYFFSSECDLSTCISKWEIETNFSLSSMIHVCAYN